jgi:hypothetical protein
MRHVEVLGNGRMARRGTTVGLAAVALLALVGCGTSSPGTFHPQGVVATGAAGGGGPAAAEPSGLAAQSVAWPPFGSNVNIAMPTWLPANPGEVPAVISAKDFLLAFLYAEYRGNQDDRWTSYATGGVLTSLKSTLAAPDVTTESFTGTISFTHMRAVPDPVTRGAVDVSECFDNSHSNNTDLQTGKVIPNRAPADQQYYLNTDVLAKNAQGQWHVVSVYPVVYYPQARECKP